MEATEVFHQLPLTIDPSTKAISSSDPSLATDMEDLNKLHRALVSLEAPNQVPPPPVPPTPAMQKRSVQIGKLRECKSPNPPTKGVRRR